jgi:ribosome recycling factor
MTYQEIIEKIKPELDKTISFLEAELQKIKTGRISPSLVEDIQVECFGQKFLLKQLATISLSGPRQLNIQPWDKSYLEPIEKAIEKSNLGTNPIVDKEAIRLSLPQLSEEYRQDFLRIISSKMEEAKKTVRRWREEAWREIQEKFKEGEIREDDKFKGKDKLQELIDEHNERIEKMVEQKKKEILEG